MMTVAEHSSDRLDVIAVGAHPDDVEIGCGGTVASLTSQGYRVGIIDLTDGEPTPGSPGPDVRLAEATRAAEILGAEFRGTLALPNRRLFDTFENRVELAKVFREYRPRLVLGLGSRTPMASPDHHQASLLTEAAVFYSRLTKWDEYFDGLPVHRVDVYLEYYLAFRTLQPPTQHPIVVDVGEVIDKKIEAIAAYQTQFGERPEVLDRIRLFNQQQGMAASLEAGEVLSNASPWATRDLMRLLFD